MTKNEANEIVGYTIEDIEKLFNFYEQMHTGCHPKKGNTVFGKLVLFVEIINKDEALRERFKKDYYAKI